MSFGSKLGRGLAAFGTGFAEELPGALERRSVSQRRQQGVAREERQREIQRIWSRFQDDPKGAIQEFESRGYTAEAASARGSFTGAETKQLQTQSGQLQTAAAGAKASLSTFDPSTLQGRGQALEAIQGQVSGLEAGQTALQTQTIRSPVQEQAEKTYVGQARSVTDTTLADLRKTADSIRTLDGVARMIDANMDDETMEAVKARFYAAAGELATRTGTPMPSFDAEWSRINNERQKMRDAQAKLVIDVAAEIGDDESIRRAVAFGVSVNMEAYAEAKIKLARLKTAALARQDVAVAGQVDEVTRLGIERAGQEFRRGADLADTDPAVASATMKSAIGMLPAGQDSLGLSMNRSIEVYMRQTASNDWASAANDLRKLVINYPDVGNDQVRELLELDIDPKRPFKASAQQVYQATQKMRELWGLPPSVALERKVQEGVAAIEAQWKVGNYQGILEFIGEIEDLKLKEKIIEEAKRRNIDVMNPPTGASPIPALPSLAPQTSRSLALPFMPSQAKQR